MIRPRLLVVTLALVAIPGCSFKSSITTQVDAFTCPEKLRPLSIGPDRASLVGAAVATHTELSFTVDALAADLGDVERFEAENARIQREDRECVEDARRGIEIKVSTIETPEGGFTKDAFCESITKLHEQIERLGTCRGDIVVSALWEHLQQQPVVGELAAPLFMDCKASKSSHPTVLQQAADLINAATSDLGSISTKYAASIDGAPPDLGTLLREFRQRLERLRAEFVAMQSRAKGVYERSVTAARSETGTELWPEFSELLQIGKHVTRLEKRIDERLDWQAVAGELRNFVDDSGEAETTSDTDASERAADIATRLRSIADEVIDRSHAVARSTQADSRRMVPRDPNTDVLANEDNEKCWGKLPFDALHAEGTGDAEYIVVQEEPRNFRLKRLRVDPSAVVGLRVTVADTAVNLLGTLALTAAGLPGPGQGDSKAPQSGPAELQEPAFYPEPCLDQIRESYGRALREAREGLRFLQDDAERAPKNTARAEDKVTAEKVIQALKTRLSEIKRLSENPPCVAPGT